MPDAADAAHFLTMAETETSSSFETGADEAAPPAEIRPLVLLLAGDADADDDVDAGADGDESADTEQSSANNLEEEMGRAVDALQRSEEARVDLSSGLGIDAGEFLHWHYYMYIIHSLFSAFLRSYRMSLLRVRVFSTRQSFLRRSLVLVPCSGTMRFG